jgi:hypothetical protein
LTFIRTNIIHNQKSQDRRSVLSRKYGMQYVPLQWSTSLAQSAQAYANRLVFKHSETPGLGENLGGLWQSSSPTPSDSVNMWTNDEEEREAVAGGCNHFTQVLWRSTRYVGCGMASKPDPRYGRFYLTVCQYKDQGNIHRNGRCDFWKS